MSPLLLLMSLARAQGEATGELEAAYQKEYAFLAAEKATLTRRLDEVDADARRRTGEAEAELERLQGRLVRLTLAADQAQDQLALAEQAGWDVEEDRARLGTLASQAGVSLDGFEVPEAAEGDVAAQGAQLEALFAEAAARVARGSEARLEDGAFFLPDGSQAKGRVLRLGHVAALGVSEQGAGALAPAGDGHLQLWPEPGAEAAARARVNGQRGGAVGLFLFESLEKRVEEKPEKTLATYMEGGGAVGWIIAALGVVALALAVFRLAVLARHTGDAEVLLAEVLPMLQQGRNSDAVAFLSRGQAAGRVMAGVVSSAGRDREARMDVAMEGLLREAPRLERFGSAILVIAAVAPLLGLLGTVTGMIATFDIITEFGTGDPKMLSGGISEALITTQLGLIVAIPAVLLGNALSARTEAALSSIERGALALVNLTEGAGGGRDA